MLMMLFVLKRLTNLSEKLKYRTNIFWKIFYSAIYLKYWLTTLVNLVTLKIQDSSKAFNQIVVVMVKRILWIRVSSL